jgi:hypothetical protein
VEEVMEAAVAVIVVGDIAGTELLAPPAEDHHSM